MVGADLARVQKAPSRNLLRRYSPLAPPSPARLLRRSYCYDGGANMTAERWPPSREGMEFDTGLMFVGFRRDARFPLARRRTNATAFCGRCVILLPTAEHAPRIRMKESFPCQLPHCEPARSLCSAW